MLALLSTSLLAADTSSSDASCSHDHNASSCVDHGPWACKEKGCPKASIDCADLASWCCMKFEHIWHRNPPPELPTGRRVWQECRKSCMQCGELSRCGWILPLRVADLLAEGERAEEFNERNAAHAISRHAQLLGQRENMRPSTACNHVTNAFFLHQVGANNPSELQADAAALEEAMRDMFTRAGVRYLAALDTRIDPAIIAPPNDVATWASVLSDEECHPDHEHGEGGGLISAVEGEDAPLLSAVYYPSARADEHAPLVFFDPRGGDGKVPSPGFATSDGCSSLEPASVAAPSAPQRAGGPPGEPNPLLTERTRLAFRPGTGDVVVFPGWLRHGVPPLVGIRNATSAPRSSQRRVAYAANLVLSRRRFALPHGRTPSVRDLQAAGVPSLLLEGPCEERGGWGGW